ncbi:MAG TPA: alpha/beta hydrolase [candidate division Zixibacteria bacterium]|nr:alpha/beta hydrolase [candidate division Zixibacteria bacterium]
MIFLLSLLVMQEEKIKQKIKVKKPGKEHIPLKCESKVLISTGFGGLGREYPDYEAKFGNENVTVIRWDKTCTDIDSHIAKMKETFPQNDPFVLCGHSLGGSLAIELLSREKITNLQGLVLIGSSRKIKKEQCLEFIMWFPWFCLWPFAILIALAFPITVLIWREKTFDTYYELFKFLGRDGARKIHKQYNLTLKKLGSAESIVDNELPVLYVGLIKDSLVDDKDLEFTLNMFKNNRKQIINSNSIHLIEKYDPITVEKIAIEAEFIGLVNPRR